MNDSRPFALGWGLATFSVNSVLLKAMASRMVGPTSNAGHYTVAGDSNSKFGGFSLFLLSLKFLILGVVIFFGLIVFKMPPTYFVFGALLSLVVTTLLAIWPIQRSRSRQIQRYERKVELSEGRP
jgi:ABC-type antimicrobial peptide transport system permease subunit